MGNIF